MKMRLRNRTAIVTGGSKGYGYGIAKALKAEGVRVWITGRDEKALLAAARRLKVNVIAADVGSPSDWDRVMQTVVKATGGLDILVNNAGAGIRIAPMDQQTDESIEAIIRTNLTGQILGCRRAAAIMKPRRGGTILNISSGCAIHAWPGWAPYSAAKAGLNQFGHCLYTELRAHGVRVTNITPYWGATEFAKAANIADRAPTSKPDVRKQSMQPSEMGDLVVQICRLPAHLEIPDVTVQPLVQEIVPL